MIITLNKAVKLIKYIFNSLKNRKFVFTQKKMKNKIVYIGLFIITALSLPSCKNDLDVLAPGEESVSVYGILNSNEPVQNIRINKVYLTNGDAISVGQDANQINYGPGELRVSLQRFNTGSTTPTLTTVGNASKKEIVLTETVVTTATGNFNSNQRIWQTTDKLYASGEYKLTIKILSTGREITAQNTMIDSVKSYGSMPFIYVPNANPQFAFPMHCGYVLDSPPGTGTKQLAYVDYSNTALITPYKIKFKSIANAKLYDVVMRFHYIDSLSAGGANREYVDYNFATQKSSSLIGGDALEVAFNVNDFYTNLAKEIAKKPTVSVKSRTSHYMEYIVYAGDETLNTFLQVNAPSTSIAQDKPYYTNINGGIGIFASRSKSSITKELWSSFIDKIADHPSTQTLQFNKNYTFICP